jgi:hypothetical protein
VSDLTSGVNCKQQLLFSEPAHPPPPRTRREERSDCMQYASQGALSEGRYYAPLLQARQGSSLPKPSTATTVLLPMNRDQDYADRCFDQAHQSDTLQPRAIHPSSSVMSLSRRTPCREHVVGWRRGTLKNVGRRGPRNDVNVCRGSCSGAIMDGSSAYTESSRAESFSVIGALLRLSSSLARSIRRRISSRVSSARACAAR